MTPTTITWPLEPHTRAKHEILKRYLGAWFGIMGPKNPRIIYLDGFCGPGRYEGGEDGSPILAIKLALEHHQKNHVQEVSFVFVDEDQRRIDHLNQELSIISKPQNFHVSVIPNEFENTISKILDDLEKSGSRLAPTFAFIDPFGYSGAPYKLVERLLRNQKTEVCINLSVDSINRFLSHPDPHQKQLFIDRFGTSEVLDIINSNNDRIHHLKTLYQRQLEKCARYVRFFEMKNSENRVIYYLFFATNHRLGLVKMKEAFWKVDPLSGYKFSDATNPNQLVLFEEDHADTLAKSLDLQFHGRKVAVSTVLEFVEENTPYLETHMKKALRLLEEQDHICVEPCKQNGKNRHGKTFPKEVVVSFAD